MNNFIGKDNFVWWVGVIEDIKDPLFLGRCKARIFGWHTENTKLIPTDDLPWSTPLYPVNNSRNFATPMEGDYVFGFFSDGMSGQAPVLMGVFPGVPQNNPTPGKGFTALAKQSSPITGDEAIQAFEDAQAAQLAAQEGSAFQSSPTTGDEALQAFDDAQAAQLAAQEGSAFASSTELNPTDRRLAAGTQTTPMPPTNAPGMRIIRVGQPTTPTNAYSTKGTLIDVNIGQLTHACDFRFLINFADLGIGVIENPITLIQQAIKNAQNKAAAIIRTMLAQIIDKFRLVIKAVTFTLNLDPTGQIAKLISKVREVVRTINYYSKKLAEIIGQAALIVALLKELKQVIEWIKNLPKEILAMLRNCLLNFQGAVQSAVSQISLIPGQVSNSLSDAFGQLETSTSETISEAQQAEQSANVPNTLITLVSSPENANANALLDFINSQYPNANIIITSTNSASFNVANSSTP